MGTGQDFTLERGAKEIKPKHLPLFFWMYSHGAKHMVALAGAISEDEVWKCGEPLDEVGKEAEEYRRRENRVSSSVVK